MATVENPRFDHGCIGCDDCPLDDICTGMLSPPCPRNMEEYAEAVKLAEQEASK